MPATLYVWPNSWGPLAAKHPGYASLAVSFYHHRAYISWWPTDAVKGKPFNQRAAMTRTYDLDS
jgi:hypothetical protein